MVAPFTGAWIEIELECWYGRDGLVAPFTGAWIEIQWFCKKLKLQLVAPFTGAWIEIPSTSPYVYMMPLSHPSRVRGLKSLMWELRTAEGESHPSRVRGLK